MSDHVHNPAALEADPAPPPNGAPSQALAPIAPSLGMPAPYHDSPAQKRHETIRGGMDPSTLFHSFRRRLLLSLGLGTLVGGLVGAALFFLFTESSSAVQQFRVKSVLPTVTGTQLTQPEDPETFRQTQAVLMRSPFVLRRALNTPGVKDSPFFRGVDSNKQVEHLANELSTNYPSGSEILLVSLSGNVDQKELKKIVEAIGDAYEDEVIFKSRADRLKPRKILVDSLQRLNREIVRKSEALEALIQEQSGGWQGLDGGPDPESRMLMSEVLRTQEQVTYAHQRLINLTIEF